MISWLKGQPKFVEEDHLTMVVNGVGYELLCSNNTITDLTGESEAEVFIHTHVREDALQLFGFSTPAEKKVFLSLIKVNGIGPKLAITILSATTVDQIVGMIEAEDAKALAKLPRIGKKTAEQIILSLKGKLVRASEDAAQAEMFAARQEIMSALVHLGFRVADVEKVVAEMEPDTDVQAGVRMGLSALTN